MAALLNLRVFKFCLLVASILLMLMAVGVMLFGTRLEIIPANAVPILSVLVWLGFVVSVIRRWFRSRHPSEKAASQADLAGTVETALSGGASMLGPTTGRGSTVYGVVLGEAGWGGRLQLVTLDERGKVLQAPTFDLGILQIAIQTLTKIPTGDLSTAAKQHDVASFRVGCREILAVALCDATLEGPPDTRHLPETA